MNISSYILLILPEEIDTLTIYLLSSYIFYSITCFIRFKNQLANEDFFDLKKQIATYKTDHLIKIFTIINYMFLSHKFYFESNNYTNIDFHKIILLIDHIIIACIILNLLIITYFPWFLILTLLIKSIMLLFGHNILLNVMMIFSLILNYYGLSNKPYKGRKEYNRIKSIITPFIFLSLIELF